MQLRPGARRPRAVVWGCLLDPPGPDDGLAALERRIRSAADALAALERQLAPTPIGSLASALAARAALRRALAGIDPQRLREVSAAIEDLGAELRALESGLALARRLGPGPR